MIFLSISYYSILYFIALNVPNYITTINIRYLVIRLRILRYYHYLHHYLFECGILLKYKVYNYEPRESLHFRR